MTDQPRNTSPPRDQMPSLPALISLGFFSIIHFISVISGERPRETEDLTRAFAKPGAQMLQASSQRLRAFAGLDTTDVVTRHGHYYYRPDIDHLSGQSFLKKPRSPASRRWNPLPAIINFDQQLKAAGIRLVLLPVPSKASLANEPSSPMANEGYREFLRILRSDHGIEVLDLVPLLNKLSRQGTPPFLEGDSHWSPQGMSEVARFVAEKTSVQAPGEPYQTVERSLSSVGNLTRLMGRTKKDSLSSSMVLGQNDEVWKPRPGAPFLLLGDSFSNIYSQEDMGWGKGAGLAEMLSLEMSAPVDRIAFNSNGAFASREALLRYPERLANKSIVVWQFAMRELSFGNWKILGLPELPPRPAVQAGPQTLEGTILRVAELPPLKQAPFRQAVREVLLGKIRSGSGRVTGSVILLGYAVQDHLPTGMARWEKGDRVSVQVLPWEAVKDGTGDLQRFSLRDPEQKLQETPRFWMK